MSGFVTDHMKECCMCLGAVDTREVTQGGDADGCEIEGGLWVCSSECWDDAVAAKDQALAGMTTTGERTDG